MTNFKISLAACEALRKALDDGVPGATIARKLGVGETAIVRHRYRTCKHIAERTFDWEPAPLSEEEWQADTSELLKYYETKGHTNAQRQKAFRLRQKLRQA